MGNKDSITNFHGYTIPNSLQAKILIFREIFLQWHLKGNTIILIYSYKR